MIIVTFLVLLWMKEAVAYQCWVDRYKAIFCTIKPALVVCFFFCELDWFWNKLLGFQPSSSCSFDGSLKSGQSDCDPNWPEVPPVLNQNEDRKRNKYLRKDYLKVRQALNPPYNYVYNFIQCWQYFLVIVLLNSLPN